MKAARYEHERIEFSRFVDREVLAIANAGVKSFAETLRRLPSVYPTELLASIDRLARRRAISPQWIDTVRSEATQPTSNWQEGRSLLPLPHPLDFEWRYSSDSSRDLLHLAIDLTPPEGHVLLYGTPGLAVEALSLSLNRRISFLGEDNVVTQRLTLLNQTVGSPLTIGFSRNGVPQASADVVLVDPPWYMDFIGPMLRATAVACRPEGIVLISLPPIGTRPTAGVERATIDQIAMRLGFDLLDCQPLAIDYDTPFFERNALAAAGVHSPARWRRGDLLVLRRVRSVSCSSKFVSHGQQDWIEASIDRMRLFVRSDNVAVTGNRGLVSLIDGDILPSVSRRDPRRRYAQVWTSGNRVFQTDNPGLVLEAALSHTNRSRRAEAQGSLWDNLYDREAPERVGRRLRALAALESDEERDSSPLGPIGKRPCT